MGIRREPKYYTAVEIFDLAQRFVEAEDADLAWADMPEDQRKSVYGGNWKRVGNDLLIACDDAGIALGEALSRIANGELRQLAVVLAGEKLRRDQNTLKRAAAREVTR